MSIAIVKNKTYILLAILSFLLVVPLNFTQAAFTPTLKILNSNLELTSEYSLPITSSNFDIAKINLGGDNIEEIVLGSGAFNKPVVSIILADGKILNTFLAYNENFQGGVNVAACDLNSDGIDEIITGAGIGGGPHVRIFDSYGNTKFTHGFFADNPLSRNGVKVACADTNGDKYYEIITAVLTSYGVKIKYFTRDGKRILNEYIIPDFKNDFDLETIDLGGDGISEILIAGGRGELPIIKILRADGTLINEFYGYDNNFYGGINLSSGDINNDNKEEIIIGAGFMGGPHLRVFDSYGKLINEVFAFESDFRGGVHAVLGNFDSLENNLEFLVIPNHIPIGQEDLEKYIEIDISEQKLTYYEKGFLQGSGIVSTGMPSMSTPLGEFPILNKIQKAWSPYGLWMPYWLGLGRFGIHELPIWPSGYREGEDHLGKMVSHGCIRMGIGPAEKLYDWADIGTLVIIHE